ncbi:MAG: hypothetical protein PHG06_12325 [Parabacteroides sp.]|nr:hypothetical protein [Parabacteroides sp.]
MINELITTYFNGVNEAYHIGNVESSYYAHIITLVSSLGCEAKDMSGERKGETGENVDIKLWHLGEDISETEPFAGIEAKKIEGIDKRALRNIKTETLRYGNVILTDNLEWQFYRIDNGEVKLYSRIKIIELRGGKLVLLEENLPLFFSLLRYFLMKDPAQIKSSSKLAQYMATHAKTIHNIMGNRNYWLDMII